MATVTQVAPGNWVADAGDVWSTGLVPPIGADVDATGNFALIVDDDTNALLSFDRTGSTEPLMVADTKTLDVDGNCALDSVVVGSGTISVSGDLVLVADAEVGNEINILLDGTGDVTDNAFLGGGSYEVNSAAGTHTVLTDVKCHDLKRTLGAMAGAFTWICAGDVSQSGGTGNPLITMSNAAPSLAWDNLGGRLASLTFASGSTVDLTEDVYSDKYILNGVDVTTSNGSCLRLREAPANWWTQTSLVTVDVIADRVSNPPGGDITLADQNFTFSTGASRSITLDANIDIGTGQFNLGGAAGGAIYTLDMVRFALRCGPAIVGNITGGGSGIFKCGSGTIDVASFAAGNAANAVDAIALDSCHLECSGLFNGDNIAITADTGFPPEMVFAAGGKVTNTEPDNEVGIHGDANVNDTPGTNNLNITNFINNQSYPGSLATMGIGGGRLIVPFWMIAAGISSMTAAGIG